MDDTGLADESRSQDEPPASPLPFWEVARLKILRARTITEPLPRIPPMTADIPPAMTLHELWDWKDKWTKLARAPTSQERRDLDECMRQENELGSETTYESDDPKELYMQTRRNFRKRPMSPPSTPPHLKGRKLPRTQDPSSELRDSSKVQKGGQKKQRSRIAPQRPMTRSWGIAGLSLHPHRKDQVLFWPTPRRYTVLSHEKYLRDYNREEIDKNREPLDLDPEDPRRPRKTDQQREVCRRIKAQDIEYKKAVEVPWGFKGMM